MQIFDSLQDDRLLASLQQGAVGVVPTDTIYGLVALASNERAVARLYAVKHREHKPGTLIAANTEQLVALGLKRRYLKAVEHLWPDRLSVIIPTGESLEYLRQGVPGLAVRVPSDKNVQALLLKTGPLLTTSANMPGEPPANTLAEAQRYFNGKLDFYVDGGDLSGRPPSTVIRIVDDTIEVVRQGAVKVE